MLLSCSVCERSYSILLGWAGIIKDRAECNTHQEGIVGAKLGANQNSGGRGDDLLGYIIECENASKFISETWIVYPAVSGLCQSLPASVWVM